MKYLRGTIVDWGYHLDEEQWEKTSSITIPFVIPLDFMIICVEENIPNISLWKAKGVSKDHPLFGDVFTIKAIT